MGTNNDNALSEAYQNHDCWTELTMFRRGHVDIIKQGMMAVSIICNPFRCGRDGAGTWNSTLGQDLDRTKLRQALVCFGGRPRSMLKAFALFFSAS
jgi:hypothetical protein